MPRTLGRRDFLKLGGAGLLASAFPYGATVASDRAIFLGRIISNQYIFDRPTEESDRLVKLKADDVINVYEKLTLPDQLPYDRNWFRTDGGYVNAATVQPVQRRVNRPLTEIPATGLLGEITVPFTDARWYPGNDAPIAYRLYYATTYWIKGRVAGDAGSVWYKLWDDLLKDYYYVPGITVRTISTSELTPLSPGVADKRIEVNLTRQTVEAFEGERSVLKVPTSTGRMFPRADGGWGDFRTPTGEFIIQRKRASRHMAATDLVASDGYDLPGVPWVSYILWWGISFHGTYWHNDFGRAHSHGCINLRPEDAKWVFRWSLPVAPYGEEYV
ncbi:MAG: L,D-transpeptidase, partial [Chloroflexi bacterium]|nr:L,D-transpeptidase [Chloroflexota bacterium]